MTDAKGSRTSIVFSYGTSLSISTSLKKEKAADVSFRDDDRKWGRIEVSWWVRVLFAHTGRRHLPDLLFDYLLLPVAGQHQFSVALNRRHLIPVVSATSLIGHLAVEIRLDLSHRDLPVTVAVTSPVGSAAECC